MTKQAINLPEHNMCSGCGACIEACPKQAISFIKDELDAVYPHIDEDKCVKCGRCQQVCHINTDFFYPQTDIVYAGWSCNEAVRKSSASGGMASAIYVYALSHGYKCYGVAISGNGKAEYIELTSMGDIAKARNSKYLYSYTGRVYSNIRKQLSSGEKVVFIGLPCQVAGLISFLGNRDDNLILVDIICHGTCPEDYLKQHINSHYDNIDEVLFRDPGFGTNQFVFSMYKDKKRVYSSIVHGTDVYQLGYHEALIYRENCFHCKYAQPRRVGDITISDFSGLGKIDDWNLPRGDISCVLCSSQVGQGLLSDLVALREITLLSRPAEEAFQYEKQLSAPSIQHPLRSAFVESYKKNRDFETSMKKILKSEIKHNRLRMIFKVDETKRMMRKIVPAGLKKQIKRMLGKENG